MNVPVEAQSLSALIGLLANPPAYPRNPTHVVSEPLVLYIVRVPGSKDVFLSPLKPPTKASISLEAIQSSLYYLHVETEEDEELKRSIKEQKRSEENDRPQPPIHRKPLPSLPPQFQRPRPRSISPTKHSIISRTGRYQDNDTHQSERHAFGGLEPHSEHEIGTQVPDGYRSSPSRNSRGFQQGQQFDASYWRPASPLQNLSYDYDVASTAYHQTPHLDSSERTTAPYTQPSNRREINTGYDQAGGPNAGLKPKSPAEHQYQPALITLIRRDPVSGGQWNVGRLSIVQSGVSLGPLNPVSIEITTPGYSRFSHDSGILRPETGLSDSRAIKEALANGSLLATGGNDNNSNHHTFTRLADYQQYPFSSRPVRLRHRADSSDSFGKPPSPTKSLRQIYSFSSPWQGICTFSNGIDGRSLKCRHTLASSTFTDEDTTVNVAELRFNLPWSIQTPTNERELEGSTVPISKLIAPRVGKETFKRGLQHFKNLSKDSGSRGSYDQTSSTDDKPMRQDDSSYVKQESELDRLSLKLGREKAGGGFKGQSAKLGKLIIEDEGLKMCDLVVAACMGVWWQHYEGKSD